MTSEAPGLSVCLAHSWPAKNGRTGSWKKLGPISPEKPRERNSVKLKLEKSMTKIDVQNIQSCYAFGCITSTRRIPFGLMPPRLVSVSTCFGNTVPNDTPWLGHTRPTTGQSRICIIKSGHRAGTVSAGGPWSTCRLANRVCATPIAQCNHGRTPNAQPSHR